MRNKVVGYGNRKSGNPPQGVQAYDAHRAAPSRADPSELNAGPYCIRLPDLSEYALLFGLDTLCPEHTLI